MKRPHIELLPLGFTHDQAKMVAEDTRVTFVLANGSRVTVGFDLRDELVAQCDMGFTMYVVPKANNAVALEPRRWP